MQSFLKYTIKEKKKSTHFKRLKLYFSGIRGSFTILRTEIRLKWKWREKKTKANTFREQTSMMWPSQNFLLYNGAIMQMIKKEKSKLLRQFPPPFCNACTVYKS